MRTGCFQIYTGNGKGKTTASVGLSVRAVGAGMRVFIGQFIKGHDSAEMKLLRERCPEMTIEQFGFGRFVRGEPAAEDIAAAVKGIERLREVVSAGAVDLVIADEINGAVAAGLLEVEQLLALISIRPAHVELVFTGRSADARIVEQADLVTEMRKVKHCYDGGTPARDGIEF